MVEITQGLFIAIMWLGIGLVCIIALWQLHKIKRGDYGLI